MIDPERFYDIKAVAEAARLTGLDMVAIADMAATKTFDWVAMAHLIKASRDRLEPYADLPPDRGQMERTSASLDWIRTIATRLARDLSALLTNLEEASKSYGGMLQWQKDLLRQITLAAVDLRDLAAAPNIQGLLLPEPQYSIVENPSSSDAN